MPARGGVVEFVLGVLLTGLTVLFQHRLSLPFTPRVTRLTRHQVGGRKNHSIYRGSGCSSNQFLEAIRLARIRPDGLSRDPLKSNGTFAQDVALPFDLVGCPTPHVFTKDEACDLLSSFGGLYMRGDSFVRHVHHALMMILRDRTDGGLKESGHLSKCRGDGMFVDRSFDCVKNLLWDSQTTEEPVCGGQVHAYIQAAQGPDGHNIIPTYRWIVDLPISKRIYSPIIYQSGGIHHGYIEPVLGFGKRNFPGTVNLWAGLHAPGVNIPKMFAETQGREIVKAYNEKIEALLALQTTGFLEEGAMKVLPFYNVTEDAFSYDGVHYAFQVNMEKAQLLLNLLDIVWGDIAQDGGLVELKV
ncbi:hypothetical protein T439DRAFT_353522 [Meredithblackwellia eburnea MCA 4105]